MRDGLLEDRVDAGQVAPSRISNYVWYALAVLIVVYTFSWLDRQILSILAEGIRADLNITDAQLGFLYGTVFAIFYTVFGIPLGRLADNWPRTRLIAIGIALWSAMTMVSGLAGSFTLLAVARIGVGVGEASCSPAAYSLIGSYFPRDRRGLAIGIYSIGAYLGMGLSLPLGGRLAAFWADRYPVDAPFGLLDWQFAFLMIGTPGLLIALWVLSLREPEREAMAGIRPPISRPGAWRIFLADVASIVPPLTVWSVSRFPGELARNLRFAALALLAAGALIWLTGDIAQWTAFWAGVYGIYSWAQSLRHSDAQAHRLILGSPYVPLALLAFGCQAIITYSYGFWVAPFAMRTFDMPIAEAGTWLGVPGAVAAAAGVILGGRLSDVWSRRDPRGRLFICMISSAMPLLIIPFVFTSQDRQLFLVMSPAVYFFASMYTGAAAAALQDLVLPRMYGLVGAMFMLASTIIGLAIGPYATGKLATLTGSLQTGVLSMLAAPPIALVALWILSRLLPRAEAQKVAMAKQSEDLL